LPHLSLPGTSFQWHTRHAQATRRLGCHWSLGWAPLVGLLGPNRQLDHARRAGWRDVPVDNAELGESVLPTEPVVRQVFVACGDNCPDQDAFERKLFVIRKRMDNEIRAAGYDKTAYYVASMSSRTVNYKGMLLAARSATTTWTCATSASTSALALVHQRFSTNTFPTWDLAQPFRMICHNGEINTLRGNVNWMAARRHTMAPRSWATTSTASGR
jgi:glutamate synthase (NADPH/NADH) large chain